MADYRHEQAGERQQRAGHRDHGPESDRERGMFGSGWSGFGPDPRQSRGTAPGDARDGERERSFGSDDGRGGLPIEETSRLIASNKVEGTPVYSRDRHKLGTIYNFMVDKVSGQVEYAVLRYGGFLGMGQRYYPLPWRVLTYHRDAGGYVIDMMARDFEDAPSFDRQDEPDFDTSYGRRVNSWYGLE